MDINQLKESLIHKGIGKIDGGKTILGSFSEINPSSLKAQSNRLNSSWIRAEYVIVKESQTEAERNEDIENWKNNNVYDNQYLVINVSNSSGSNWECFDSQGKFVGYINTLIPHLTTKVTSIESSYIPYISAIRTKPFLLLAGISGSGQSRIVRELARACWPLDSDERKAKKPENYELIQVKPNWHDSSELIGYVSHIDGEKYVYGKFLPFVAKAWANLDKPYFLCLDEMNLAPVEQYFAEYLSVIETRKLDKDTGEIKTDPILESKEQWFIDLVHKISPNGEIDDKFLNEGIALPPNLVVVGTVNMDETTFTFSRKVLDRAMTIEMNDVDLRGGLTESPVDSMVLDANQVIGDAAEGMDVYADNKEVCGKVIEYLETINAELEGTPFKIGYRARNEFLLYALNRLRLTQTDDSDEAKESVLDKALDEMTSMKILSRIEGEDQRIRNKNGEALLPKLRKIITDRLGKWEKEENKPISVAKLEEMEAKPANTGFTSFWS